MMIFRGFEIETNFGFSGWTVTYKDQKTDEEYSSSGWHSREDAIAFARRQIALIRANE